MIPSLEPRRLEGWTWTRVLFAGAALGTWLPRGRYVTEAYSSAGVVVSVGPYHLTDLVIFSPITAWGIYGSLIVGLLVTAHGKYARVGLMAFLLASTALMLHEGLWIKAYDRLMFWQAFVLLFAPGGGDGDRVGSPAARYAMIVVYCGIYGATGWNKILHEPAWWRGEPLAYLMVSNSWGGLPIGVWLSTNKPLLMIMSWWTLLFEGGFPFLVWWRRANPWLLLAGACMHAGILVMLRVNTFTFISLAAYPILLDPDFDVRKPFAFVRRLWTR